MIEVLGHTESHTWLGCMLCACRGQDSDVECDLLQQAAKAFQKHRWMLPCKDCCIKHRLRCFEAIVSSTACFAAEHRPLYKKHFKKYDIQFQKFVRRIVEPPPGTNWSPQWHDIVHEYARGLLGPCKWTFLLVKKVRDSILEFRFLHCKLTCRTLGEESTCVATTSNTSFPWMPTASLGH